jgi:uncharacterized protein (DUF2132 family)
VRTPDKPARIRGRDPLPEHDPRDPRHGITLEQILNFLVEHYGWKKLGRRIPVRCFHFDPTLWSSLVFLRKTPWARVKVERLIVSHRRKRMKNAGAERPAPGDQALGS